MASAADAGLAVAAMAGPGGAVVRAVLCFVAQPQLSGWSRDVMICSTDNLLAMLLTRPVVLTAEQVTDLCFRLGMLSFGRRWASPLGYVAR